MFPQDRLTPAHIDDALPRHKPYKLTDGAGLYIEVMPTGAKYWRLKYRLKGKERRLALGVYPAVSIESAREQRQIAKRALVAGLDPLDVRRSGQEPYPIAFRLTLDDAGGLTIDTATQQIRLTPEQTNAVRAVLWSNADAETAPC